MTYWCSKMTWMGEWDDYYLLLIGSFPHSLRLAPIRRCVPEDGKNSSLQIWKRWMVFFPHMSILLVIDKIMNFQSPTYPKLQLVPPTAQSNTDFGDFKCTSLGLDSWTVHQPISQSNHLGVHRIPSNLMGMIFQPLRIVELYILSPSN